VTDRGPSGADTTLACPFVAYEDDRDARSDHADHRHRCYAEVRPAPRATAHQETYCLTAAFGTCPTFQDWARREAARVRWPSARPSGMAASMTVPAGPAAAASASPPHDDPAPLPPSKPESAAQRRKASSSSAADADATAGDTATAAAAAGLAASRFLPPDETGEGSPNPNDRRSWAAPPPWSPAQSDETGEAAEAPAPEFLRDSGTGSGALAPEEDELLPAVPEWPDPDVAPAPQRRRRREHVDLGAPSWEEPRRFEAYPTVRSRVGMPSLSRPLAGLIVLVFAAAALFLLPSFFFGGGGGAAASPSPSPSASARPSPSPSPEPSPTPVVYVVKKGDTMTKIANAHGVTLEALMEANKETVTDPNKVKVGQELIIPVAPADGSEAPAESPAASEEEASP
jgi:nucleoid-associated protein YgaU